MAGFAATTNYVVTFSEIAVSQHSNMREYKTQVNAWKAVQKHVSNGYGFAVFAKIEDGKCSQALGIRCVDGARKDLRVRS